MRGGKIIMPIATQQLFGCTNCGFKSYRTIGDVRPDINELKPCPKCKSRMAIIFLHESSMCDKIEGYLGSLFDGFGSK